MVALLRCARCRALVVHELPITVGEVGVECPVCCKIQPISEVLIRKEGGGAHPRPSQEEVEGWQ